MYDKELNEKTIDYMQALRGFSDSTRKQYMSNLNLYSEYHDMSLEELLEEAEEEEDENIRMRKRKINNRILDFQNSLKNDKRVHPVTKKTIQYSAYSINSIIDSVKMFYTSYNISLPMIRKQRSKPENVEDVITKKEVRKALRYTHNVLHRAIILTLAGSGLDVDTLKKITVGDYLHALRDYTSYTKPEDKLEDLSHNHELVPTFIMQREKSFYEHVFFFSPEACDELNQYLLQRYKDKPINTDDLLIPLAKSSINRFFSRINDTLGFGWTSRGTRRRFRPHGMRSFFATTLQGMTIDGMLIDTLSIEFMLGHSIPAVTAAYYKKKPELLKNLYIRMLPHLVLMDHMRVKTIKSPEYMQMEEKLKKYDELEEKVKKLEMLNGLYSKLDEGIL